MRSAPKDPYNNYAKQKPQPLFETYPLRPPHEPPQKRRRRDDVSPSPYSRAQPQRNTRGQNQRPSRDQGRQRDDSRNARPSGSRDKRSRWEDKSAQKKHEEKEKPVSLNFFGNFEAFINVIFNF